MAPFPCPRERIAASALLLLSTMPPSHSSSYSSSIFVFEFKIEEWIKAASKIQSWRGRFASSDSKSCASSICSDLSMEEVSARSMRIDAVVPGRREMRLKVLRKSRSKIQKGSSRWKFSSDESSMTLSASGSISMEASCLSSTTCSADSSARSRHAITGKEKLSVAREELKRSHGSSAHIRRRADGILNMLSDGCYSEVRIRQVLGDSPDTSKALRMLLKLEEGKRSGTGGRQDPTFTR